MILRLKTFMILAPAKVLKERNIGTATDAARTEIRLDPGLLDLVSLRLVQIHGCELSVQKQILKLKARGSTDHRIYLLNDWRRQTIFSLREKAALNLAEALACNPLHAVPYEAVRAVRLFFSETEMICLFQVILAASDGPYLNNSSICVADMRNPHEHQIGRSTIMRAKDKINALPGIKLNSETSPTEAVIAIFL
jgi:alkylhydroperoxidase family enzyme